MILLILYINAINSELSPLKDGTIYTIDENIEGASDYKTKTMTFGTSDTVNYFQYDFGNDVPTSKLMAFRLDFIPYSSEMDGYKVLCTNVLSSASDTELINQLKTIKNNETLSSCLHLYQSYGYHDSIMKLDSSKPKIGIAIYLPKSQNTKIKINLRIGERILGVEETKPEFSESYSMVPITVNIQSFRDIPKSKILLYSSTRTLQMYETVSSDSFPTKLFSGNILNVYTNPDMVRQKYHDAMTMSLIANSYGLKSKLEESFKFEVLLFDSNFLLDYYVSSNPEGRPLNSPLLINMTECTSPYYVILNYNAHDSGKTLILDEIYGKLSYFGVATKLEQETWEDMLEKDIQTLNLNDKRYSLPLSANNMDVYKLECTLPIMLNFYYIDETAPIYTMDTGDVQIFNLQPYQTINVPFKEGIKPEIMIEVNQPENNPYVILTVTEEKVIQTNTLEKYTPWNLNNGITIKERGGSDNTRVIIKVGYPTSGWVEKSPNIKYNSELDVYSFEFPNDKPNKPFYYYAQLTMSGTNADDNVKFCFTTSIGGALKPSSENCYRVSKTNSYSLKVYNPYIMYKNYKHSEDLKYSVTLKPVNGYTDFGTLVSITKYDTNVRNYEGVNNKLTIPEGGKYSSILTPPELETTSVFLQVQVCDDTNNLKIQVLDILTQKELLPEETISPGSKNVYRTFLNQLMDSEFYATAKVGTDVFLRMVGLNTIYTPSFTSSPEISFDNTTNTLFVESPLTTNEDMKITVLVDKENVIKNKGYTLCSFVDTKFEDLALYYKTVTIKSGKIAYIQINFDNAGINAGEKFDAIVYFEQQTKGQMVFLSKVYQDIVGEISVDVIHELNETYPEDNSYLYVTIDSFDTNYYFSYLPEEVLEVPIGAFSLEIESQTTGEFTGVYCTFVDPDADALTMIEEVENAIQEDKSYCIGSKSSLDSRRYNYIFKYEYDNEKPKKMVIKVVNGGNVNGVFNLFMKIDKGEEIASTDFDEQREYGESESSKKSIIPYIVDVEKIRGKDEVNYISKVLFYAKNLEMQMYYVPTDSNKPIKLFGGNIALVYTKPTLAEQKYHSKVLILITENLEGESHPSIGGSFRFHTKMFRSESMIEFFVSQNPDGRTLHFPLSLEMTTCTPGNNKLYYLLNYNAEEPKRRLHLDMLFGKYSKARIATQINQEHWDSLLNDGDSMVDIVDFKAELPPKSQHIDVIEVVCETPLVMNAYYTKDDLFYADVERGGVAMKMLPAKSSFSFSLQQYESTILEYTISIYNPNESPDVTATFSDGTQHHYSGNSLQTGIVMNIPERVTILNNCKSETRFIFKYGLSVESTWHEESIAGIDGKLFFNEKAYVYKFPITSNKRNFMNVEFKVNSINDNVNTKFCYSTNLGTAISTSRENCFRTGRYIPYTLTFLNPLIIGKNYYTDTDRYYISFKPFDDEDSIKVEITENQYSVQNRNELGTAKEIDLIKGSNVKTILTMPLEPKKIHMQFQMCTSTNDIVQYQVLNAFNQTLVHSGKIYSTDKYGITYVSPLTYMENEILFKGDDITSDIKMFTKHADISDGYEPNILSNYTVSFDPNSSVVTIEKPIQGEPFTFTVIIKKTDLSKLTLCDVTFASDKTKLGDYVNTFTSISSNRIIHYVDFGSIGYQQGTEFYVLVHAVQMQNSQMEFIYPVIKGVVTTATGTIKIDTYVEGENEYMTTSFKVKSASNYLYYDFTRVPTGNVASIRINTENTGVSKVGCTFVSNTATSNDMINAVNKAIREDKNYCLGDTNSGHGFNALVNAKYTSGNNRLVIQVLYSFNEGEKINEDTDATIVIKTGGTDLSNAAKYSDRELHSPVPYVIDLLKIRGNKDKDYTSKILFYSNTREMQMFYITENSTLPVSLFTGNIMLVYTNEELIKQKYQGATTMILLSDALTSIQKFILDEQYRFITYFFKSDVNIQYFLSGNSEGRPLNNPTAIEMTSCTQPYYYIMNYNKVEEDKKLHIDTIFGQKKSIRLANSLNEATWDDLLTNMIEIKGDEAVLEKQDKFHFDVIEVTCNVPLLINLFYVDPEATKVTGIEMGDITVLSMEKGDTQDLTFKLGETGPFIYTFTVERDDSIKPKITVIFDDGASMNITENGVYNKYSLQQYSKITIKNIEYSGNTATRVIFKFGFAIEMIFEKDEKGVYSNQKDTERKYNLYGYIYDQTSSKYNLTGVDFKVSTTEDNVKFCYSTNLGTYIYPSLQNCYRVGKNNPYTIATLNPNVMYRNYTSDDHMNYYVGFRTVDIKQNIIITPIAKKYDTTERNIEGEKNKVKISDDSGEISTILTAPKNHEKYVFVETCLCTKKQHVSYQFLNAYNHSNLGSDGELNNNNVKITVLENTLLDTELKIYKGQNGNEIFVKHVGYNSRIYSSPRKITIGYNRETQVLNWTQPLINEKFNYTIYIDKIDQIKRQKYTLCSIAEVTKLAHHKENLVSDSRTPNKTLNFSDPDLGPDFGEFDVVIIAEQMEKQKFIFMSDTYDSLGQNDDDEVEDGGNKTGLVVVISILSVIIIVGGVAAVLIYMKYRKKGRVIEQNKQTSMALLNSTQQEKLTESTVTVDP